MLLCSAVRVLEASPDCESGISLEDVRWTTFNASKGGCVKRKGGFLLSTRVGSTVIMYDQVLEFDLRLSISRAIFKDLKYFAGQKTLESPRSPVSLLF